MRTQTSEIEQINIFIRDGYDKIERLFHVTHWPAKHLTGGSRVCVCGGARRLRNLLPQLFTVWLKSDLTLMVA